VRGFTVEPGNSNVVYLAGEVSSWEWNGTVLNGVNFDLTKGAVYKTIDGGQNWSRIWYGDNLARYIIIHPENHNLLYVSTGIFDREAANSNPDKLEPGGIGILRSRDGGESWEELGIDQGFHPNELYIGSLMMHPNNPDILIAAAGNDAYLYAKDRTIGAIYRTMDGGDSWERALGLPNASSIEICSSNPDVVYAGSANAIYRSDDGGGSWQLVNGGADLRMFWGPEEVAAGFPIDMQCDLEDPMRIFVNNYGGGNFLSEDGGSTWINASDGYTGAGMHTVVTATDLPGLVYASARSGLFISTDGGDHWDGMARGIAHFMEAMAITTNPQNPLHLVSVIGDSGQSPKFSRDGGKTWRESRLPFPEPVPFYWSWIGKIAFSPAEPNRLVGVQGTYICVAYTNCPDGFGVLFSRDGGESWKQSSIKEGVATEVTFSQDGTAYIAILPGDLYKSIDHGETWTRVAKNINSGIDKNLFDPDQFDPVLISLAVDPVDSYRLYAGFSQGGVMISDDGGESWQPSLTGMIPETAISDIAVDLAHPGVIYAASLDSGVYRSLDHGESWRGLNEGLTNRSSTSLSLSSDGKHLYLATSGGGVFRLSNAGIPPEVVEMDLLGGHSTETDEEAVTVMEDEGESAPSISQAPEEPSQERGMLPYIFVGAGILLVLGIVFIVVQRRRS
jgi:photosystem II stability/assembly factor-like uncharacterized protein